MWTSITGTFYRAVDPAYRDQALDGSRSAGRYNAPDQPTLYLSCSREGVEAAMIAHRANRAAGLELVGVNVEAENIFDLRDEAARREAGVSFEEALAPWQEIVAEGGEPSSWRVRRRLEELGAHGLLDPSRKAPGLWHLVLFSWNTVHAPSVRWDSRG